MMTIDETIAREVEAAMAGKEWCSVCCEPYEPGLLFPCPDTNQEKSVCPWCGLGNLLVTTAASPTDIKELYSLLGPDWPRMKAACGLFNKGFTLTRIRKLIIMGKV